MDPPYLSGCGADTFLSLIEITKKRTWAYFTCLLRCIDHANVISKLEGTQHGSEDSKNQGPGDLWGMKHRAGKHQAIPVTIVPSLCSLDFWQAPLAGSCPLILIHCVPYAPGRAHSYETVGTFHFPYTAKAANIWDSFVQGRNQTSFSLYIYMCIFSFKLQNQDCELELLLTKGHCQDKNSFLFVVVFFLKNNFKIKF